MAALPYMPLFVADYLADTAHLTPAQHGAYLLLIMNYWQRGGPLPNDDVRLARIARMSKRDWTHNREAILEFFTVQDNLLHHNRISAELSRVEAKSLKCKDAAQASVQRRFGKRSTPVEPTEAQAQTEVSEAEASSPRPWALPIGVSLQVWTDFLSNRKKKRLNNTPTAWKDFNDDLARVSQRTGIPPPELIRRCTARGWGAIYDPTKDSDNGRTDRMARHKPSDGLSSTTRAAASVFGVGASH